MKKLIAAISQYGMEPSDDWIDVDETFIARFLKHPNDKSIRVRIVYNGDGDLDDIQDQFGSEIEAYACHHLRRNGSNELYCTISDGRKMIEARHSSFEHLTAKEAAQWIVYRLNDYLDSN